ncbi:MAG TPA: ABC transporter permease [Burkholderiales bacterium]|nr:ABC transporter permease [Burkholderiales bacterium]
MPAAAILARFVLLEARRSGLPWLVGASLAAALGLAAFVSQVALTESIALQSAFSAALLRACAVFLVALHVAACTVREVNDKGLELMLTLPLSRSAQYAGRLTGYVALGVVISACFALPLLLWSPPVAVLLWAASLALETALVAAAALFFSMALVQPVPAFAATAGLYLLARAIGAVQSIAASPLAEPTLAHRLAQWAIDVVALLLPRLDAATRTEWLIYGAPSAGAYATALAGLALYSVLLVAAGLFDFHRRNL